MKIVRYIAYIVILFMSVLFLNVGIIQAQVTYPTTQIQSPSPEQQNVTILNSQFNPANITVNPGTTVAWVNQDVATHTIVSDDPNAAESWNSGNLPHNQAYFKIFNTPGTYTYHIADNTSATGTVTVTGTPVNGGSSSSGVSILPQTGPGETVVVLIGLIMLGSTILRLKETTTSKISLYDRWVEYQYKKRS